MAYTYATRRGVGERAAWSWRLVVSRTSRWWPYFKGELVYLNLLEMARTLRVDQSWL